jgi:hypothetical protein
MGLSATARRCSSMTNPNDCHAKAVQLRLNARETSNKDYQIMFEAMASEWDRFGEIARVENAFSVLANFNAPAEVRYSAP